MKNNIYIKILDNKVLFYKNKKVYTLKSNIIMENNYIVDYIELESTIKNGIIKNKLQNRLLQNKIIVLINKLYSKTNNYIIKNVLYNIGYSNYELIYEEDLYKDLYPNILSIWDNNGIYIKNNVENYIDINNKQDLKRIKSNTLLITSNKDITDRLNKDIIMYEETDYPIFKMFNNISV